MIIKDKVIAIFRIIDEFDQNFELYESEIIVKFGHSIQVTKENRKGMYSSG